MARYNLANNDIAISTQQNLSTAYKTITQIHATTGATTLRRGWIYDVMVGADGTPADNVINWVVNRNTTAGTATSHAPTPLEGPSPTGDAAALLTGLVNHTIEPTVTDVTGLIQVAVNQRASYRWVAAPGGELVVPAVNVNGIGVRAKSPAYASTATASMSYWE
jgi:hypothetical protein